MLSAFTVLIKEEDKPLSIRELPTAIKIAIMPMSPNSLGPNRRARISWAAKALPFNKTVSKNVHIRPEKVCFFNDNVSKW